MENQYVECVNNLSGHFPLLEGKKYELLGTSLSLGAFLNYWIMDENEKIKKYPSLAFQ